jgi:hypothetical protein
LERVFTGIRLSVDGSFFGSCVQGRGTVVLGVVDCVSNGFFAVGVDGVDVRTRLGLDTGILLSAIFSTAAAGSTRALDNKTPLPLPNRLYPDGRNWADHADAVGAHVTAIKNVTSEKMLLLLLAETEQTMNVDQLGVRCTAVG